MADSSDYSWIVLVIIVGAGMLVLCCYAVLRFYNSDDSEGVKSRSNEQLEYMRAVRQRNFTNLEWLVWSGRPNRVRYTLAFVFPYVQLTQSIRQTGETCTQMLQAISAHA
jgi:hypothetical protein